jgi:hypothetical protein
MLVLWLGLSALALSPLLHRWLHRDFTGVQHECVVTLLTKGHLLAGGSNAVTVASPVPNFRDPLPDDSCRDPSADYRLSPSRAPPFFVSHS